MAHTTKHAIRYHQLALIFLKTGAQSFGGWSTTALLLEQELIDKRKLLTAQQLKAAIAYAQILPGATQVAIVSNVGHQLRGIRGSLIATLSYLLPTVWLIILFAMVYFRFVGNGDITEHLDGLMAALGGVILANAYRIGVKHVNHQALWLLVGLAFAAQYWLHVSVLITIVVFGTSGLVYYAYSKRAAR